MPPPGPGPPPGVTLPPLGPEPPPGPGPPLLALVDLLPGAPSQSLASAAGCPGGPLVLVAIAAAPGGWARRPISACPVTAPRSGMWRALSRLPPTMGHIIFVCFSRRGPAPALAPCVIPSALVPTCAPAPPRGRARFRPPAPLPHLLLSIHVCAGLGEGVTQEGGPKVRGERVPPIRPRAFDPAINWMQASFTHQVDATYTRHICTRRDPQKVEFAAGSYRGNTLPAHLWSAFPSHSLP